MTELVYVEADGGSRGNPGPAGYGAVVLDPATGAVLAERNEFLGVETNNVAEYRGLIAGLEAARDLGARQVVVRMDSKLVVQQMKGEWQIKHEGMRALAKQAVALRNSFAQVTFEWIPREQNKRADRLANEAMDRGTGRQTRPTAAPAGAAAPPVPSWAPPSGPRTRLVLVRHGATVHSGQHRLSGRNDLALNDAGVAQAAALAATLRERPHGDVAAIVASPLRRARETAAVVADALDIPLAIDDDLAEVDFGAFEGLTIDEVRARFPDDLDAWDASPEHAPPHGESFAAAARRVRRARDRIVAAHPDAAVVVVSHVTPIKLLVRAALDAPLLSIRRMHLDIASISVIDYLSDGAASLRLYNAGGHLDQRAPISS